MITTIKAGQASAAVTVATTPLRVFGASTWTGADAEADTSGVGGQQRLYTVSVASGSDCYFQVVTNAATLSGSVSSSDNMLKLSVGQTATVKLAPTQTLAVVSAGSSTVRAVSTLEVA